VGTADGRTVGMNAAGPGADVVPWYAARAKFQLNCDFVGVSFLPKSDRVLPGAMFLDVRSGGSSLDVRASDQGRSWVFQRVAVPEDARAYEEPDYYRLRRKADRLPLELLGRYLTALGVPVDDPGYLSGPVLVCRPADRGTGEWKQIGQLRELRGYPLDVVPRTLTD
jgi:hypothetical protein